MIIPLACFLVGAMAMGSRAPKTKAVKLACLGPRSGYTYAVEDFREIGTVVVRAPAGRAVAWFTRVAMFEPGKPGLAWHHGVGDQAMLDAIRADFGVPRAKPTAVKDASSVPRPAQESAGHKPQSASVGRTTP